MASEAPTPDLNEVLHDLAIKVERVKQLYEQYFMGIEKMEPLVARKEVTRAMLLLQQQYIRNTGLRFRFQTMLQKWSIYITYWTRTLREIENGTNARHVQKAKRAAARDGRELPKELVPSTRRSSSSENVKPPVEVTRPSLLTPPVPVPTQPQAKAPSTLPPPLPRAAMPPPLPGSRPPAAPPPSPRPPAPTVAGMSEAELRQLHQKFGEARKQAGEAGAVSYEALVSSLSRQVPKLLEQPGVKSVRFDVAVKDGKAILKAIPSK